MSDRPYGIEWVERVLSDDRFRRRFGIPEWVDALGLEFVRDEACRLPTWVAWDKAPLAAFRKIQRENPQYLSESA